MLIVESNNLLFLAKCYWDDVPQYMGPDKGFVIGVWNRLVYKFIKNDDFDVLLKFLYEDYNNKNDLANTILFLEKVYGENCYFLIHDHVDEKPKNKQIVIYKF